MFPGFHDFEPLPMDLCANCGFARNADVHKHTIHPTRRAVMITFEVFEKLEGRRCYCGSEELFRVCANVDNKFAGEFSLTLSMCENCRRLYQLV